MFSKIPFVIITESAAKVSLIIEIGVIEKIQVITSFLYLVTVKATERATNNSDL